MASFKSPSLRAYRKENLMLARIALLGAILNLALFCFTQATRGEDEGAKSNPSTDQPPAAVEQTQGEQEAIEIPLGEIWALDMPGTRDVGELEPDVKASLERLKTLPSEEKEVHFRQLMKNSSIWHIRKALQSATKKAAPGFAVSFPEPELLKAVRDQMTGVAKQTDSFPAGSDITAVFFSSSGLIIHIYRVERRANLIEIQYRYVPHEEDYMSEHFALVPLGKLPSGNYEVKIVQGPMEQEYLDFGYEQVTSTRAAKFVSQSFEFEVRQ